MVVELLRHDITQEEVKEGTEGDKSFLEMDKKTVSVQALDESIASGLTDSSNETNGLVKEGDNIPKTDFLKDAGDEWPTPKQIHTFYFVKYRSFGDPKLMAKIEEADRDIQKKTRARVQIIDQLKEKRSERSNIISQLKPLTAKDKEYRSMMDLKRKEMEPLQAALGELRSANMAAREKRMGLCSSEEELDDVIHSLHYRMQHESLTLVEEKQLIKEIKQLEGTREKVIANATRRAEIQDSLGHKEVIQGQVKLITGDIDGVRKEQQAVRTEIKILENELNGIDEAINSLQQELNAITEKNNKAYGTLTELRKARDEVNACYFQNRSLLNSAKDLAAKKDLASLQGLSHNEMEKFMSHWSNNKAFREDYEKRILPSLESRMLSIDGRMRNPDEKPITFEAPSPNEPETIMKASPKQAKEDVHPRLQHDISPNNKQDGHLMKSTEAESGRNTRNLEENINVSRIEKPEKNSSKSNEIDTAKIKEIKREEEIAKAKMAMQRKKKLAEKAAAKATVRAQKEAERKLKEKQKRAKKNVAGASTPASAAEESQEPEMVTKDVESEETNVKNDYLVSEKSKQYKERLRYRTRPKGWDQIPNIILKKKKSHSYWSWAAPAAVAVIVLGTWGYYSLVGKQ